MKSASKKRRDGACGNGQPAVLSQRPMCGRSHQRPQEYGHVSTVPTTPHPRPQEGHRPGLPGMPGHAGPARRLRSRPQRGRSPALAHLDRPGRRHPGGHRLRRHAHRHPCRHSRARPHRGSGRPPHVRLHRPGRGAAPRRMDRQGRDRAGQGDGRRVPVPPPGGRGPGGPDGRHVRQTGRGLVQGEPAGRHRLPGARAAHARQDHPASGAPAGEPAGEPSGPPHRPARAFCSPPGATGIYNGRIYTCKGPGQPRWRR